MRWLRLLRLFAACGLTELGCACAAVDPHRILYEIYSVAGEIRPPPDLVVDTSEKGGVAWYAKHTNQIFISRDVIAFLEKEYGVHAPDAVAILIGHEFAHFKFNHGWAEHFGLLTIPGTQAAKDALNAEDAQRIGFYEGQADYYGLLYAHLSGYNIGKVIGSLYGKLYARYKIPEGSRYPRLPERELILRASITDAQLNILPFDSASLLMLIGANQAAEKCYAHIGSLYPGREVLNNCGVASLLRTLEPKGHHHRAYPALSVPLPFVLDTVMQLDKFEVSSGPRDAEVARPRHIEPPPLNFHMAKLYFGQSVRADASYAPPRINLACVAWLEDDYPAALFNAKKAVELANKSSTDYSLRSNAYLALGIAHYLGNNRQLNDDATAAFDRARQLDALTSWSTLARNTEPDFRPDVPLSRRSREVKKTIAAPFSTVDFRQKSLPGLPIAPHATRIVPAPGLSGNELRIESYVMTESGGNDGTVIVIDMGPRRIAFARPNPERKRAISAELSLSASMSEVEALMGTPIKFVASRAHTYGYYPTNSVILEFDSKARVTGWIYVAQFD